MTEVILFLAIWWACTGVSYALRWFFEDFLPLKNKHPLNWVFAFVALILSPVAGATAVIYDWVDNR